MAQMIVSFNLDRQAHHRLAQWLESLNDVRGRRTAEIVRVLEAHVEGQPVVVSGGGNAEILAALARIEAQLQVGNVAQAKAVFAELPADVLANLDALAE